MRVLLARPNDSDVYVLFEPSSMDRLMPPMSLMYLESYLLKSGHIVEIWDGQMSQESFIKVLRRFNPEMVGVGGTTPEANFSYELFELSKKYSKDIITVAGGPHFQMFTQKDYPSIDYIIKGDGEVAITYLADGNLPDEHVIEMPLINKLFDLPELRWDKIKDWHYNYTFNGRLVPTAAILSSRGCKYKCTFCHNSKCFRPVRNRAIPNVVSEIKIIKSMGINHLVFLDETFSLERNRTIELCREMKKFNMLWKCLTRADRVDKEVINEMANAGCVGISIGVESGNSEILKNMKKMVTKKQIIEAFDVLSRFEQIEKRGSFILGHPYETEETVEETIRFACSLPIDKVFFNIMTPYPSSVVYDQAINGEGIYLMDSDWKHFRRAGECTIRTESLSPNDFVRLQKKAHKTFYTQPRIILKYMSELIDTPGKEFYNRPLTDALKWDYVNVLEDIESWKGKKELDRGNGTKYENSRINGCEG